MLSARLIELIETHADALTRETLADIASNPRTRSFHSVSRDELESRVYRLYHNLGRWLGQPDESAIEAEYGDLGRRRFREGVPLSDIISAVILYKRHLNRYVREHGLIEPSVDRVAQGEMLPVHLYGMQELYERIGEFFDKALYHLTRGYESQLAARGA
jgi:hypothetical protein